MRTVVSLCFTVVGWLIVTMATPEVALFSAQHIAVTAGVLLVAVGCGIQANAPT